MPNSTSTTNEILSDEEQQLLDIRRAIKRFDQPHLISVESTSHVLAALQGVVKPEDKLSIDYIDGLIAGIAIATSTVATEDDYYPPEAEGTLEDQTVSGGSTGGVVYGQTVNDPRYVKQTGVHEGQNDG